MLALSPPSALTSLSSSSSHRPTLHTFTRSSWRTFTSGLCCTSGAWRGAAWAAPSDRPCWAGTPVRALQCQWECACVCMYACLYPALTPLRPLSPGVVQTVVKTAAERRRGDENAARAIQQGMYMYMCAVTCAQFSTFNFNKYSLAPPNHVGAFVCELGAGCSASALFLSELGFRTTAVDLSPLGACGRLQLDRPCGVCILVCILVCVLSCCVYVRVRRTNSPSPSPSPSCSS